MAEIVLGDAYKKKKKKKKKKKIRNYLFLTPQ